MEDVKEQATRWKEEATNLLSNALEEKFNLDDLKESKCYSASMNALASLGDAKSTIVQQFEDQKENIENGKYDEVFNGLKSIASETGDTFKKFEMAAGCLAKKFGYKAYSISVGVTKGWYYFLSLSTCSNCYFEHSLTCTNVHIHFLKVLVQQQKKKWALLNLLAKMI